MPVYTTLGDSISSAALPQYGGGFDTGFVIHRDDSTNALAEGPVTSSRGRDSRVEDTVAHATAHYNDLLRKLAD